MRKHIVLAAVVLGVSYGAAFGFEIKGWRTGVDVQLLELKNCERTSDVDSGLPGYRCETTLGGEQASLRIGLHNQKVAGLFFDVNSGRMSPVKEALEEKYGKASTSRHIEGYYWVKGNVSMNINQRAGGKGYTLIVLDMVLFGKAQAQAKESAKKDL